MAQCWPLRSASFGKLILEKWILKSCAWIKVPFSRVWMPSSPRMRSSLQISSDLSILHPVENHHQWIKLSWSIGWAVSAPLNGNVLRFSIIESTLHWASNRSCFRWRMKIAVEEWNNQYRLPNFEFQICDVRSYSLSESSRSTSIWEDKESQRRRRNCSARWYFPQSSVLRNHT
jgi:hypothetical protein